MLTYIKALLIIIFAFFISITTIFTIPFNFNDRIVNFLSKLFGTGVLFLAGITVKVYGREYLNKDEAYLFVSNH